MFGGAGLSAAIAAIERTLDQPVICAAARFLSFARPPDILDIQVDIDVRGRQTSQVTAVGCAGGRRILVVGAAVGSRPGHDVFQWAHPPDIPAPRSCDPVVLWPDQDGSLTSRIEFRMASGPNGDGRSSGLPSSDGRVLAWLRPRFGGEVLKDDLAIFADYIPSAVGFALGRPRTGGNSLDNNIRYHHFIPTEWVLCSTQILSVMGGLTHGEMLMYSQDGVLLASASQSMIVRTLDAEA